MLSFTFSDAPNRRPARRGFCRTAALMGFCPAVLALVACLPAAAQFDPSNMVNDMKNQAAQNKIDEDEEAKMPVILVMKDQGLGIEVDVAPLVRRTWNSERVGLGFAGRYGFANRWYAVAELGYENIQYSKAEFGYKSNGMYLRVGGDYDIFMNEDYPTNNSILAGVRYGYSWQSHECDHFRIVDAYWGDYTGSVGNSSVNSHWLEAVFGFRCEMLPNFYMGWYARGKVMLLSAHDDNLNPYAIAGFGQNDKRVGVGFSYLLEYQIPTNRLKKRRLERAHKAAIEAGCGTEQKKHKL